MSDPNFIQTTGVIVAVRNSPGPASAIEYDVDINIPGVGVKRVDAVKPHNNRPPDDYDTIMATNLSTTRIEVIHEIVR